MLKREPKLDDSPETRRIFWLLYISLIVIFTVSAIILLISRYQSKLQLSQERVKGLTGVYSENLLLLTNNIESILRAVGSEFLNQADPALLDDYLDTTVARQASLRGLFVIDNQGIVVADGLSDDSALGRDNSGGDGFRYHSENNTQALFIRDPQKSPRDNHWAMPVSLGIQGDAGEFRGIVAATIEPVYFSGSLSSFISDDANTIKGYILTSNGTILTTIPFQEERIGISVADHEIYSQINADLNSNVYTGTDLISDDVDFIAYQKAEPYNFIVVFTQSRAEVLQSFVIEVVLVVVSLLLVSMITYFVFRYLYRQTQKIKYQALMRQEAELAVVKERNLLRTLIDNIPDYIFVKDKNLRFIETNIAHANSVNLLRDQMLNRTAMEIYDPELARQFEEDDKQVIDNGEAIISIERVTSNAAGQNQQVLTTKIPLRDADGNITGLVGISRDITDLRMAEEQRLETERLRIEIEKEREVLELKQRFITIVSHDFRTPLAIVKTTTSLLDRYLGRYSEEQQRDKLGKIQNQVNHMTNLLNDVLTLSKIQSGRVEISSAALVLQPFCEGIWNDMLTFDDDKHRKQFLYQATAQQIIADGQLLQQILVNLLSNAFKYTPDDKLVAFEVSNDGTHVIFRVRDEGLGIPQSELEQLYQPFFRATNVHEIEGTGLGLAITKEYINWHRGTIDLVSEENKGTTFTVRLPL